MQNSVFVTILYICFFIIVVGHVYLKGVLGEGIFRHSRAHRDTQQGLHPSEHELLDYVTTHLSDIEDNAYANNPKAANFYSDVHDSDIHHEKSDLSKYFEIERSVPDTDLLLKELQCKDNLANCKSELKSNMIDKQTGSPMFFDKGSDGTLTFKPDIWVYENERVMNGGYIDGIRGIDNDQSDYAVYQKTLPDNKRGEWETSYPYAQTTGMF